MSDPKGRVALPAMVAGAAGLVAGVLAAVLAQPWLGLGAGALALLSGLWARRLGQRLNEQGALQQLVEDELRTVRTEAQTTEKELRAEIAELTARVEAFEELDHFGTDGEDDIYEDGYDETDDGPGDSAVEAARHFTDPDTGLFSEPFFAVTLDARVAAARRHLRPVALVLIDVVEGLPGGNPVNAEPNIAATSLRATLRDSDMACRLSNGSFALLLEDTPENGAIWTVERIRRSLSESHPDLTLWAGIACYPAHAFSPGELLSAAGAALISARDWRQDRIEVAAAIAD